MSIHLTPRLWLALFALALAVYAAVPLLPLVSSLGLLLFLTALLTLLINPLAARLERRGIHRQITAVGVLMIIGLVLGFLVLQIMPLLVRSFSALAQLITQSAPELRAELSQLTGVEALGTADASVIRNVTDILQQTSGVIGTLAGKLGNLFFTLFVMVVLVITLVSKPQVSRKLMQFFVPQRYHARVTELTLRVSEGLARWFVAQVSISLYYIIAYGLVNTWLGVPYALPIAILSGLLEFIPYLGGIVGLALSVLAAATVSPATVMWVIITNTLIGTGCVYFVSPFMYARAINIPVAAVLLGLFIGLQVGGFFAALLTIPVVTIVLILVRELRPPFAPPEKTPVARPTPAVMPQSTEDDPVKS
jgi:predicted PurR-regulated permease PerM